MDHSDIDHESIKSAYLKVIGVKPREDVLTEVVDHEGEQIDEARLVTRDGKFIVMTDNDTEAATFEDRESAIEYIKNNKDKLMVRDDKARPATTDKVETKESKEIFIVPEEIVDTKERNAFMGAAAAAHKSGQSHFNFAGKKHKVTMNKDTAKAINNSVKEDAEADFKPHMMYDPKTGKGYEAKEYADHVRMDKMGYVHDKPKMDEDVPAVKQNEPLQKKLNKLYGPKKPKTDENVPAVKQNEPLQKKLDKLYGPKKPKTDEKLTPAQRDMRDAGRGKDSGAKSYVKHQAGSDNPHKKNRMYKGDNQSHDDQRFVRKGEDDYKKPSQDKLANKPSTAKRLDMKKKSNAFDKAKAQSQSPSGRNNMGGVGVREMDHPQANLTKTQRRAYAALDKRKPKPVTLPGMDLLKKDDKPKMQPGRQSQIVKYEGYEADVSKFMNKHDIDHHWSGGKLHVDKKDHARADKKLEKKYGGYGPRGAKMKPQLHINKESTMVTRSNWLEKFYEKRNGVNEDYKQSPHHSDDATRDTYAKQLSTRKGEEAFVKAHEIQTPEYADGPAVNIKTFAAMTAGVNSPKMRPNDNDQGDKTPVSPVNVGKAGGVGAKD